MNSIRSFCGLVPSGTNVQKTSSGPPDRPRLSAPGSRSLSGNAIRGGTGTPGWFGSGPRKVPLCENVAPVPKVRFALSLTNTFDHDRPKNGNEKPVGNVTCAVVLLSRFSAVAPAGAGGASVLIRIEPTSTVWPAP